MDGLFSIFVIIGIVNAVLKWFKKQQAQGGKPGQGAAPEKPWQRMLGELVQSVEEASGGTKKLPESIFAPAKKQETPESRQKDTPREAASSSLREGDSGFASEPAQWRGSLPGTGEDSTQWRSSLTSMEGTATLSPNLSREPEAPEAPAAMPSPVRLSFRRDDLMQAVVMHEILTRPQDRRRRWGNR